MKLGNPALLKQTLISAPGAHAPEALKLLPPTWLLAATCVAIVRARLSAPLGPAADEVNPELASTRAPARAAASAASCASLRAV